MIGAYAVKLEWIINSILNDEHISALGESKRLGAFSKNEIQTVDSQLSCLTLSLSVSSVQDKFSRYLPYRPPYRWWHNGLYKYDLCTCYNFIRRQIWVVLEVLIDSVHWQIRELPDLMKKIEKFKQSFGLNNSMLAPSFWEGGER